MIDRSQDERLLARHRAWQQLQGWVAEMAERGNTLTGYIAYWAKFGMNEDQARELWIEDAEYTLEVANQFRGLSGNALLESH